MWRWSLCPTVSDPASSPGRKWWQTILEIKVSCNQRGGFTCTIEESSFFSVWGRRGGEFFFPFHVPNMFSLCSHRVPQLLFAHGKRYLIEKQGGLWEKGYFLFGLVWPSTHKSDTPFFPFDAIQLDEPPKFRTPGKHLESSTTGMFIRNKNPMKKKKSCSHTIHPWWCVPGC